MHKITQSGILNSLKLAGILLCFLVPAAAFGTCSAPANLIEKENCLPGSPQTAWDISGAGDPTLQGFATDISVNAGQTISFKIKTDAAAYTLDIYRMGYYKGNGARLVASIQPSVALPQTQPPCVTDSATSLYDCGNWQVSASWPVPADAVSGIYFVHLVRTDTGGDSHIVFIVRNDASHSAILFQTSDETWEAYNGYGGASFYGPDQQFDASARAFKVSYNRPFDTRSFGPEASTWVFGAEYPMVRFLEANGYDVTYFTGIDAARNGGLILNHRMYMATGHDEYWSGSHRASVEAARDAGVNMAFFSGNEVFWKTRLEPSIDGLNTPNRTLVCYKETFGPVVDPQDPPTWTGTWRDGTKSPPADGGRPENSLTGTLFTVNGPGTDNDGTLSMKVPYGDAQMRFWRNTTVHSIAPGTTATLPKGTLGYEWDQDIDNGSRPAGLIWLSTATYTLTNNLLLDQGSTYGAGKATHHLTLYRAPSGALVFGAGSVQWSWGLDSQHDNPFFSPNTAANTAMRQATVNLFADMGVQPTTLQSGLVAAAASSDTTAPTSNITWPTNGATLSSGSTVTITGTAQDAGGGVIGAVEVSVDGGKTWHPATGRENWTYTWTPNSLGSFTLESRATDDSVNTETPTASSTVVTINPQDCPCDTWTSSIAPSTADGGDGASIEVGVRFRSDFAGYVTGLRFYKASTNKGTHIGNLWSNTGVLLGRATFTGETASGWQQVSFDNPIAIDANTTYVASYFAPVGHYSATGAYFASHGADNPPIHLLRDGVDGSNGIYSYSQTTTFPSSSFNASNYWIDVVFIPASSMPGAPPALLASPSKLSFLGFIGAGNPAPQTVSVYNQGDGTLSWTANSNVPWISVTPSGSTPGSIAVSINPAGLSAGTYNGAVTITASGATNPPITVPVSLNLTNLLLSSNFADGTMQGWAFSPLGLGSNWSVSNSALQYNGGGHTQVYSGNSSWTDYSLTAAVKLPSLSDYPGGIRGRVNPITGAGYAVWLYPAEGLIKLFRNVAWNIDSGVTLLGQAPVGFDATAFHNVQLSFQGTQIQVSYDFHVVITATDATYSSGLIALDVSNQPVSFTNILVTSLNPNTGLLTLATNSVNFAASYGSNPSSQNVQLGGNNGTLAFTAISNAPWLIASPAYGSTPTSLSLSASSSSLAPGTYSGNISVVSLGSTNTTQNIGVSLSVAKPVPLLVVSPSSINVIAVSGQSVPVQSLAIANGSALGDFAWTASSDSPWLNVSSSNGTTPSSVNLTINTSGLTTGSYTGHLTISASGVPNSPQTVPITVQVLASALTETFADQGSGWIVSPMGHNASWSASSGVYSYSGAGLSQSCAGNSAWSDYAFDTNIQLANLSNWPGGVRARVNPATGAGYAVWLYPGINKVILYRVSEWDINAGFVELAEAPLSFDTSVHDLTVDFRGSVIAVYWDGAALMSANDATYGSGFVCLDADNQPVSYSNIRVSAVQNAVTLDSIVPSRLTFNASPGATPPSQTINITAGATTTTWGASANVSWLRVVSSGALTPATLTASVNPTGLSAGTYNGTITLSVPGATNSSISIPVTLSIDSAMLAVTPAQLTFFGASTLNPVPQIIQIANIGTGVLSWTAGVSTNWLKLSAVSGAAPSSLTVSPDTSISGTGNFTDAVVINSGDVANGPISVPVSLQVGSLLFSDGFTSGAGNWTISPLGNAAGWSVVNGAYAYNGGGHTQSFAGATTWTNYTVAADFQLSSLNDYPGGLRGRVNVATGASYGVWIYPAEGVLKLFRIGQWNIDNDNSLLGQSGPLNIDTNRHNLRLLFQGTAIKVYYDNVLVITAADASYGQGAVALDVSNQPIAFDNVTVISVP